MKKKIPCRVQTAGQGIFIGKMPETYFAGNRNGTAIQPDKMFHVKQCNKVPVNSGKTESSDFQDRNCFAMRKRDSIRK